MATPPVFSAGAVLTAAQMNAVGMWLVKTQAVGSAVTSVSVTGAFSADFENYLITWGGAATSTGECLQLKLGSTTTGYYAVLAYEAFAAGAGGLVKDNNASNWTHVCGGAGGYSNLYCELLSPYATRTTGIMSTYNDAANTGMKTGFLNDSTSYTDFTLTVATGTITGGTVRVYGYRA